MIEFIKEFIYSIVMFSIFFLPIVIALQHNKEKHENYDKDKEE